MRRATWKRTLSGLLLVEAGIDAVVSEDLSPGGLWMCGTPPEIHKPQVWINAGDAERASRVLRDYERQAAQRSRAGRHAETLDGPAIEVRCDECHEISHFPQAQQGTIQDCPRCGA